MKASSENIRPAKPGDAEGILEVYRYYVENTAISFEQTVPTISEMSQRITMTTENYPWLVSLLNEQIVGYAYASRFRTRPAYRWTVEVTIYLADQAKRSGIATKLYNALFDELAKQNFRTAIAVVTEPNPESEKFHQKMGFRKIGTFESVGYKLGQWHNTGWWQREP